MDKLTCIILCAGFVAFSFILALRPNLAYSNDLGGHIEYTRYMIHGWNHPYDYMGWEYFHPQLYYFLTGRLFALFDGTNVVNPLMALRMFSLLLYVVYCIFSLRTLQGAVGPKGVCYFMGVLLIVFWPMWPMIATRISNDIPLYTAWVASFYFLEKGYREKDFSAIRWSLICLGFTFMIKSNALVLMAVVGSSLLYAFWTKRFSWSQMFTPRSMGALAFLLFSILFDAGRLIYTTVLGKPEVIHSYLGEAGGDFYSLPYFFRFSLSDYIAHPVVTWTNEPGFLNYFFKSMFYGEQQLGGLQVIPAILDVLLLLLWAIVIFGTASALIRRREKLADLMPYMLGVAIPVLATAAFTYHKHYVFCQSVRYVLPMIIPLIILHVRAVKIMSRPGYYMGVFSGTAIAGLGFVLNIWLYTHREFG